MFYAKRPVAAVAAMLAVLVAARASAQLVPVLFSELLSSSTLVVIARSVSASHGEHGEGSALFKVKSVLKGSYGSAILSLGWGSEVHDQKIHFVGFDYVLFLRREGTLGRFAPAHYGCSAWPIIFDSAFAEVIVYAHPVTYVEVPERMLSRRPVLLSMYPSDGITEHLPRLPVIPLELLVKTIEQGGVVPADQGDGGIVIAEFCPRSPEFWRSHSGDWPVDHLELGGIEYKKPALLDLLNYKGTDASLKLARQLVASKLDLAVAMDPFILRTVAEADRLLVDFPPGSKPKEQDEELLSEMLLDALSRPLGMIGSSGCFEKASPDS
jgi:hypothetical protein